MPVVPFTPQPPKGRAQQAPIEVGAAQEPWVLMAASQIDSEGRLVEPHTIERGPEYDKWDEALTAHGTIRIPKELDNPQGWMNQHEKSLNSKGIDREDRPDGSVILRKRTPTS